MSDPVEQLIDRAMWGTFRLMGRGVWWAGREVTNFVLDAIRPVKKVCHPPIRNLKDGPFQIFLDGLLRGLFMIGDPGKGKTSLLAYITTQLAIQHPDLPIIVMDASGPLKEEIIYQALTIPGEEGRKFREQRLIIDEPGHPEWVKGMPDFSEKYGMVWEDQVQRVTQMYTDLNETVGGEAGIMAGVPLKETLPELCRILTHYRNEYGEPLQITEARTLLNDQTIRDAVIKKMSIYEAIGAQNFFNQEFGKGGQGELNKQTYFLRTAFGTIEPDTARARFGANDPAYTFPDVIKNGNVVVISGEWLANQPALQNYTFGQIYSLLMAEVYKRRPNDPKNKPVLLIIDELYVLLKAENGISSKVGEAQSLLRARNFGQILSCQSLWQLSTKLREQVWSMGGFVSFAQENVEHTLTASQQKLLYDNVLIRQPAKTDTQLHDTESLQGEFMMWANWLQRLKFRECIQVRYKNQSERDEWVYHIKQTPELPPKVPSENYEQWHQWLLKKNARPLREALEVVRTRRLRMGLEKGEKIEDTQPVRKTVK